MLVVPLRLPFWVIGEELERDVGLLQFGSEARVNATILILFIEH